MKLPHYFDAPPLACRVIKMSDPNASYHFRLCFEVKSVTPTQKDSLYNLYLRYSFPIFGDSDVRETGPPVQVRSNAFLNRASSMCKRWIASSNVVLPHRWFALTLAMYRFLTFHCDPPCNLVADIPHGRIQPPQQLHLVRVRRKRGLARVCILQ